MDVRDDERLSRFLLFSRWFSRVQNRVKPDAYIPHPRVELSVSCTEALAESEVWPLGQAVVDSRSDNVTLYGRGDVRASVVRVQKLQIIRDDQPLRHANIVGWPIDSKESQRMLALEIAAASSLVIHEI